MRKGTEIFFPKSPGDSVSGLIQLMTPKYGSLQPLGDIWGGTGGPVAPDFSKYYLNMKSSLLDKCFHYNYG